MQLPRASTSALADGYCTAIVAESLVVVSADVAVTCCAVVGRAGNPAARKSEMPIAAKRGRALPIASPPPFGSYRLRLPSEVNPARLMTSPRWKSHHTAERSAGGAEARRGGDLKHMGQRDADGRDARSKHPGALGCEPNLSGDRCR